MIGNIAMNCKSNWKSFVALSCAALFTILYVLMINGMYLGTPPLPKIMVFTNETLNFVCDTNTSRVHQHGNIVPGKKYVVITTSLHDGDNSVNYGFPVPLSVLAWRRIGFYSVVMLIGDPRGCEADSSLRYMVETLMSMDHVVILTLTGFSSSHSVTISQVSRLFLHSLIQDGGDLKSWRETYVITADSDIWPIADGFFDLPEGKDILHGDIGSVTTNGVKNIHVPLSYVGMRIGTWHDVMSTTDKLNQPRIPCAILDYLYLIFDAPCCEEVIHGGQGWGLDQSLISLRIHQWKTERKKSDSIFIYSRNFWRDRIDRAYWKVPYYGLKGKVDSHILHYGYKPEVWEKLRPLLLAMYDINTVVWCERYAKTFNGKT